jgi:hypothetical protein
MCSADEGLATAAGVQDWVLPQFLQPRFLQEAFATGEVCRVCTESAQLAQDFFTPAA